jgi:hypothetical protein
VTASQDTSFGKAAAVIGIRQVDEWRTRNNGFTVPNYVGTGATGVPGGGPVSVAGGDHTNGARIDQAYVAVGSGTVIMAGLRRSTIGNGGSIANSGDDAPFSYLFISDTIDGGGVLINNDDYRFGGTSLQVSTDLGNGLSASVGLENIATESGNPYLANLTGAAAAVPPAGVFYADLGDTDTSLNNARDAADQAGTLIGVLQYQGEGVTAHVTGVAFGVLDGTVNEFAVHAGATGTFDIVKVVGAVGYSSAYKGVAGKQVITGLISAQATFDMFTLAASAEAANWGGATDTSVGGKIGFSVADGVTLNLDGAWFHNGHDGTDTQRVAASAAVAVTETLTLSAEAGGFFGNGVTAPGDDTILYGKVGVVWAPGPKTSVGANVEVHDDGAWRTELTTAQSF